MSLRCRLGWHRWRFDRTYSTHIDYRNEYAQLSGLWIDRDKFVCSRCGKAEDRNERNR